MLSQHIAEKIHAKVNGLIERPLAVADENGQVLAGPDEHFGPMVKLDSMPVIEFSYSGKVVGYVVLAGELAGREELTPLIRSIAELVMHQSILIEQIPQQEERLDKFIYDLLNQPSLDPALATAEARLFDIDLSSPRIALVITVEDPLLENGMRDPSSDRELRVSRYKFGITRSLQSFYTFNTSNIVAYLGSNMFCILKDLSVDENLQEALESFKKSINTIYEIIKSELKLPTTVGVGNYHPGFEGLRISYQEAVSAIELGSQNWDSDRIYHIDDFGVVAPLLSGVDEQNIYFSRELLDKLGENSEIIQTLEAFFTHDMSLTQTANTLGIHRNTLVYRLDRISTTLGLDPRSFDDAVQIKLAILFTKFVEV